MMPHIPLDVWCHHILPHLDPVSMAALAQAAPELGDTIRSYANWVGFYKTLSAKDVVLLPGDDFLQVFTQRSNAVLIGCDRPYMPSPQNPTETEFLGQPPSMETPQQNDGPQMPRQNILEGIKAEILFGFDKKYVNTTDPTDHPTTLQQHFREELAEQSSGFYASTILSAKRFSLPPTPAQLIHLPGIAHLDTVQNALRRLEISGTFPTEIFCTEALLEDHGVCVFGQVDWHYWRVAVPETTFPEPMKEFCSLGFEKRILLAASGQVYSAGGNEITPIETPSKILSVQPFDSTYYFERESSANLTLSRSACQEQPNGALFLGENGIVYYYHPKQPTLTRIPVLEFIVKVLAVNGGFLALASEGRLFFMGCAAPTDRGKDVVWPVEVNPSAATSGKDARDISRSEWPLSKTSLFEPHNVRESDFSTDLTRGQSFSGSDKCLVYGFPYQKKDKRGEPLTPQDSRPQQGVPSGFRPVEIVVNGIIFNMLVTEDMIVAAVAPHLFPTT